MFDEIRTEQATEAMEHSTEALELSTEALEQATEALEHSTEALEGTTEALEGATEALENIMDALDLTQEERQVFASIQPELDATVENSSGNAKVYGDCISTTCSYTTVRYSCPYTK